MTSANPRPVLCKQERFARRNIDVQVDRLVKIAFATLLDHHALTSWCIRVHIGDLTNLLGDVRAQGNAKAIRRLCYRITSSTIRYPILLFARTLTDRFQHEETGFSFTCSNTGRLATSFSTLKSPAVEALAHVDYTLVKACMARHISNEL
jgi:hypothetical protein